MVTVLALVMTKLCKYWLELAKVTEVIIFLIMHCMNTLHSASSNALQLQVTVHISTKLVAQKLNTKYRRSTRPEHMERDKPETQQILETGNKPSTEISDRPYKPLQPLTSNSYPLRAVSSHVPLKLIDYGVHGDLILKYYQLPKAAFYLLKGDYKP